MAAVSIRSCAAQDKRDSTRSCSVDGCKSRHYALGFCGAHYKRFRKYGDPLAGGIPHGAAQRFAKNVATGEHGDECVLWPYYRNVDGVARINWRGRATNAHSIVCELAHGPKPTPQHECCHSCGNGNMGCVNPRHLYWGTRSDNVRDAIRHGTAYRFEVRTGEDSPSARYSDKQIRAIRAALKRGEKQIAISKKYGISQSHVSRIKNGART
ncbi:helix-turn-helix domain-containing protein [Pseudohoeflea coraliihabitans]|uniref:Helix-turn-helix domain-containing protein n=1 Tax=Pseudohoeflea coraliihabitans TaxID=2860393 RepID=A0ABS6WTJ2_9HYPH|nr:helix-turn-helix domain-containing protein [Pseudohoeflea sp. DP4N28-3]